MLEIKKCPICQTTDFNKDLVCKDYTVSQEEFQLLICKGCGFKFTSPRPDDSVLGSYYKSEEYISHSNTNKGFISKLYHAVRNYTLKKKSSLLLKYVSRGTILDYGCGTGMFLDVCKNAGWKTYGIEPDFGAREIATRLELNVCQTKESLASKYPSQKFNVITLWHVLEHVTDLDQTLEFLKTSLEEQGVLIVAVPNYKSFDATHYKHYWAAYDVPRHLYHFERNTVEKLMERFGFNLVDTHPMKFDSFYVSMLSEKYKTEAINYLNAFLIGLKSNWKARSTHNYSSVIYVFKKTY